MNFNLQTMTRCMMVMTVTLIGFYHSSLAASVHSKKGVQQRSETSYRIVKPDPHFVLKLGGSLQGENSRWLHVPISVESEKGDILTPKLVIYYNPIFVEGTPRFKPLQRLFFKIPMDRKFSSISVSLPPNLKINRNFVRVDVDKCDGCDITISGQASLLPTRRQEANALVVEDYRLLNGAKELPSNGLQLDINEWERTGIDGRGTHAIVTGIDPFLISKPIDIDTADLGGVLVKLVPPVIESNIYNFQLFYGTESHEFTERASSLLRLAGDKKNPTKPLGFFIPLDFLANQHPPDKIVTKLRLDLQGKLTEANEKWKLESIDVIHKKHANDLLHLVPKQLIHFKFQRASVRQVIVGIIKKITTDIWFTIFFFLLVLLWIGVCIRALLRSRRSEARQN